MLTSPFSSIGLCFVVQIQFVTPQLIFTNQLRFHSFSGLYNANGLAPVGEVWPTPPAPILKMMCTDSCLRPGFNLFCIHCAAGGGTIINLATVITLHFPPILREYRIAIVITGANKYIYINIHCAVAGVVITNLVTVITMDFSIFPRSGNLYFY